jgi:RNA polymerase sigma-70 factor (ECF subfamily)
MLRITRTPGTPRLAVEGHLIGPFVDELRSACCRARSDSQPLVLDLSGLTYLDGRGIELLEELARGSARMSGGSAFVREVLRRLPVPEPSNGEDSSWIERLRQGDETAREEIVRRFGPRLLATARRLLPDDREAESALGEAFWEGFDSVEQLSATTELGRWLHSIVVRAALRRCRPEGAQRLSAPSALPRFTEQGTRLRDEADETLGGTGARLEHMTPELRTLVRDCVDELPPPQRAAVLLCDLEGFGSAEAGALLGLGAVEARRCLHRGRQTLRARLGQRLASCGARPVPA